MPELGYVGEGERVYTADTLGTALELATWCQNANWVETAGVARRTGRFPQLGGAGPQGPRKEMKIVRLGRMRAGSGQIEINHGAIEAEQLCDPERA